MRYIILALLFSFNSFSQTAGDYFKNGINKADNGDIYGAISDYTKAIKINPNYSSAYNNRAIAKEMLGIDGCADAREAKQLGGGSKRLIELSCQ